MYYLTERPMSAIKIKLQLKIHLYREKLNNHKKPTIDWGIWPISNMY